MRWMVPSLRICLALVAALAGGVVLSSCSPEPQAPPTVQREGAGLPDLSGQRINFLIAATHRRAADSLAAWFKAETGAIVKVLSVDYQDLLAATLDDHRRSEAQIDVLMLWYVNIGRLAEAGVIQDLSGFYERHHRPLAVDDFLPNILLAHSEYRGRRWAVPFDGDVHVLFYRKSLLAKHGLAPPRTWDEYEAVARTITAAESADGVYGCAIMAQPTPIIIASSFMNRLAGFGGQLFDEQMRPTLDTPQARAALSSMVAQAAHALPNPLSTGFAVSRDAFLLGQVAMVEQWTDLGIMAEDERQSLIKGDWGAVPMPTAGGGQAEVSAALNAGWVLGLSTRAPNPAAAEAFMAFAARPDITLRLNLIPGGSGIDPVRLSVIYSKAFQAFAPNLSAVESRMAAGRLVAWPKHPNSPELMRALSDGIVAALEKRLSPAQALAGCQRAWEAALEGTTAIR